MEYKPVKGTLDFMDNIIRKRKSSSRFIPNGFPDKVITGKLSDIVFTDHQARSGVIRPGQTESCKGITCIDRMKPLEVFQRRI